MNAKKILFILMLSFIFIVYVAMHLLIIPNTQRIMLIAHALFLIGPLLMVIESLAVVREYGRNNIHGRAFMYIFIGSIMIFIANVITVYIKYIIVNPIYPSPADFFYILGYPFFAFGIFSEVITCGIIRPTLIKKIIIAILSVILVFLLAKIFYKSSYTMAQNILNIFYRSAELMIITAIFFIFRLTAEYQKGRLFSPWLYLSIGGICFIIVGVLYNFYMTAFKAYIFPYSLLNSIWLLAYLFMSYGMFCMHDSVKEVKNKIKAKINLKKYFTK